MERDKKRKMKNVLFTIDAAKDFKNGKEIKKFKHVVMKQMGKERKVLLEGKSVLVSCR